MSKNCRSSSSPLRLPPSQRASFRTRISRSKPSLVTRPAICVGPTRAPTIHTSHCLVRAGLMGSTSLCQALTSYVIAVQRLAGRSAFCSQYPDYRPRKADFSVRTHMASCTDQACLMTCRDYESVSPEHLNIMFSQLSAHAPDLENESLLRQTISPFPEGAVTSASKTS